VSVTIPSDTAAPTALEPMSAYETIGGQPALTAAVDGFYSRILADPVLSPFFPGGVADRHRRYLVTILAEALGGPERYRGPDLARAHRGRGISDMHFDRTAGHLVATLDDLGVPSDLIERIVGVVAGARPAVVTV
jgi:hemoglobin